MDGAVYGVDSLSTTECTGSVASLAAPLSGSALS